MAPQSTHDRLQAKILALSGIMIGNAELRFELDDDDEFFQKKAREELRETPEVVAEAQRKIRELVKTEPELIVVDEDEYYQKFLRPCKWYADSAFALMKRYYNFRLKYPNVCKDVLPSNERNVFCSGVLTVMPLRTEDGCRLFYVQGGKKWNPKTVTLNEMFKAAMLSVEAAMSEPKTQIAGGRVIFDMDGLRLSQVTYFTPSFASMVVDWIQNCTPCRLKSFHIVNQPFIFNMVFAFFKPFLKEKLRNRIHFHGTDRASLISYTGTRALPANLGGDIVLPDEPIGEPFWKYFCAFDDDFNDSNKCGYVGSK